MNSSRTLLSRPIGSSANSSRFSKRETARPVPKAVWDESYSMGGMGPESNHLLHDFLRKSSVEAMRLENNTFSE